MRLYIDLDTRGFVESEAFPRPVASLALKRRDVLAVEVRFVRGNTVQELADGATGKIGLKPKGQFGSPFYLAFGAAWEKAGSGAGAAYSFSLSLATAEIESAFLAEPEAVPAMLEIEWAEGALRTSSATLDAEIQNDVHRGDEGVPQGATPAYPLPAEIELVARKGQPGGYAGLGDDGKVSAEQLPGSGVEWDGGIAGRPEVGTGGAGSLVLWEQVESAVLEFPNLQNTFGAHAADSTHLSDDERAALAGVGGVYPPGPANPLVTADAIQLGGVTMPASSVLMSNGADSVQWVLDGLSGAFNTLAESLLSRVHSLNGFYAQATGNAYEMEIGGEISGWGGQYPIGAARAVSVWIWCDQAVSVAVSASSGDVLAVATARPYTAGQPFSGLARIDALSGPTGAFSMTLSCAEGDYKAFVQVGADFVDLRGTTVNVGN